MMNDEPINTDEWLSALKPGDAVAVSRPYGAGYELLRVDRAAPTQIVCGHSKFRRKDGREVGAGAWGSRRICPPTAGIVQAATAERNLNFLLAVAQKRMPATNEQLAAMVAAHKATGAAP